MLRVHDTEQLLVEELTIRLPVEHSPDGMVKWIEQLNVDVESRVRILICKNSHNIDLKIIPGDCSPLFFIGLNHLIDSLLSSDESIFHLSFLKAVVVAQTRDEQQCTITG
jgi:hypothetical protein